MGILLILIFSLYQLAGSNEAISMSGPTSPPDIKMVMGLPKVEFTESLLVHAGLLWVGQGSFYGSGSLNRMYVYNPETLELKETIPLTHAPQYLYELTRNKVITVGMSALPDRSPFFKTHYTIFEKSDSGISSYTHDFSNKSEDAIYINQFAGDDRQMYFSLQGDSHVMHFNPQTHRERRLAPKIVRPGQILKVGNLLFVVQQDYVHNIFQIDLQTEKVQTVFEKETQVWFMKLIYSSQIDKIIAADETGRLFFIDPINAQVTKQVKLPEENPRALTLVGSCLAVGFRDSRKVRFYDLRTLDERALDEWDFSVLGNEFKRLSSVAADMESGKLFAKASYECPYCMGTPNSVGVGHQSNGKTLFEHCRAK